MKNFMRKNGIQFAVTSLIGILMFFIPIYHGKIPVVILINAINQMLGTRVEWVSAISCILLMLGIFGAKVLKVRSLGKQFQNQGIRCIFWMASGVIVFLKLFDVQLPFMLHPQIGGTILKLGSTVFVTIAVAGTLVCVIIESGIVEFVSVLMEPIMKPVFHLPGEAAVNIISSFVSSASVGVYFTEQYYLKKRYTRRQACAVVTSFSVVSVGYIGIIASLAGVPEMYGPLLVSSFLLVLVMGAIMIRIPPLSLISDRCIDGSREEEIGAVGIETTDEVSRIRQAWEAGLQRSRGFTVRLFWEKSVQALQFAQKIVGVMIPTVMIVLVLVYYTPIFTWLGMPLVPVIRLLGIPDAALAAPSVLIGIVEVSLPSILIGGSAAAAEARFFVALLSIVQIIFFSEAGNAIMGSEIPLGPGKLIAIFLMRTAIALPLVALVTHILY